MTRRSIYLAVGVAILATVARCEETRWLNVEVNEPGKDTEVRLHVPLPMVVAVLDAVDVDQLKGGKVHICRDHVDVDWRAVLAAVRTTPEGQTVTVRGSKTDLVVTRLGNVVEVQVDEGGAGQEKVSVRLPADVLEAISAQDESTVDIKALVAKLGHAPGEILKVDSTDAKVRIWVE
jgi:hypothetical protein